MLVGDAGYPSLPFLLLLIPVTDEEIRFDIKPTLLEIILSSQTEEELTNRI